MALNDRLRDALRDPNAVVRLDAARAAAGSGDHRLVEPLLEVALRDTAEVRVAGGLGETVEHVGDAAAVALGEILARRNGIDARIALAAEDLNCDDDRIATLLYYLGPRYEPLRQRLERHEQPRIRLRAARAVLSFNRTAAFAARLLNDPSPLLRLEGLQVPAHVRDDAVCLRLMRIDHDPRVRAEAAMLLRFTAAGVEPFAAAAREEPDSGVRAALVACLAHRRRDPEAVRAVAALLGDPALAVRRAAAEALRDATDPVAGAAIGLRILAEPDDGVLGELLRYRGLLEDAPELRPLIERLQRYANFDDDRRALGALLNARLKAAPAAAYPADGRLLRAVLRQAADALGSGPLRDWLDDPGRPVPLGPPVVDECVQAWSALDTERALTAGENAAYTAALADPAHAGPDPVRGPTTAARRALELTRVAHVLTARLLTAGAEPPPAAPIQRLVLPGEDSIEALRSVLSIEECRRARNVTWLRLLMRPADEAWYLEALHAAYPKTPPPEDQVSDWHLDLAVTAAEGRRSTGYH
ncbi:HEAT repeat domain-containing protein [Dactylosporangium sp. NPDC049140]|uniref:HEAT repeat domain-containing protein n=1 Tax=Dactylosporangium sp. NPDC049140 TaxID=3155647 RepID=UPI0033FFECFD